MESPDLPFDPYYTSLSHVFEHPEQLPGVYRREIRTRLFRLFWTILLLVIVVVVCSFILTYSGWISYSWILYIGLPVVAFGFGLPPLKYARGISQAPISRGIANVQHALTESPRIELAQLRELLGLTEPFFNSAISRWVAKCNLVLDGACVVFNPDTETRFFKKFARDVNNLLGGLMSRYDVV